MKEPINTVKDARILELIKYITERHRFLLQNFTKLADNVKYEVVNINKLTKQLQATKVDQEWVNNLTYTKVVIDGFIKGLDKSLTTKLNKFVDESKKQSEKSKDVVASEIKRLENKIKNIDFSPLDLDIAGLKASQKSTQALIESVIAQQLDYEDMHIRHLKTFDELQKEVKKNAKNGVKIIGGVNSGISLTTNGTSGAATLVGNVLNIPQYTGGGGISDGDYGDITVSGSGTVWTIDNSAVTLAKIANASANSKLLGSGASGSGSPYAEITLGTGLSMSGTTLSATGSGGLVTTPSIVYYGDGSDGNVTITGTTTLTRNMYYDTLTIASGGILESAMFKVFAKTAIDIQSGGKIRVNGNNGTNATGQAAVAAGTQYSGTLGNNANVAGAQGSTGTNAGAAGGAASSTLTLGSSTPVAGGAGGAGASSAGGTNNGTTNNGYNDIKRVFDFYNFPINTAAASGATANYVVQVAAGASGGGGGGASQAGGAGGSSGFRGGIVFLCTPSITHNGVIEVIGGNGGNGANGVGTNAGGGGGGSGGAGGYIVTVSETFTGAGTYTVTGGTGGTGGTATGTGTNGSNGATGLTGVIRRCVINDGTIYTS